MSKNATLVSSEEIEVPVENFRTLDADAKGRVTIGKEFAGKEISLAILEVRDGDD